MYISCNVRLLQIPEAMAPHRNQIPLITPLESREDETRYQSSHQPTQSILSDSQQRHYHSSPFLHRDRIGQMIDSTSRYLGMKYEQWLSIQYDDRRQPVGDNSASWTSFLGTLVRQNNIIPTAVLYLRHIGEKAEHRAQEQINLHKLFPISQFSFKLIP